MALPFATIFRLNINIEHRWERSDRAHSRPRHFLAVPCCVGLNWGKKVDPRPVPRRPLNFMSFDGEAGERHPNLLIIPMHRMNCGCLASR